MQKNQTYKDSAQSQDKDTEVACTPQMTENSYYLMQMLGKY